MDIACVGNYFPVFEAVVAERLDDRIVLIGKDDISLVKKFNDEVKDEFSLADIKNKYAFKAVLADREHFSPERYFRSSMANWGGFFGGSGKVFYEMGPSAGSIMNWYRALFSPFRRMARVRLSNW